MAFLGKGAPLRSVLVMVSLLVFCAGISTRRAGGCAAPDAFSATADQAAGQILRLEDAVLRDDASAIEGVYLRLRALGPDVLPAVEKALEDARGDSRLLLALLELDLSGCADETTRSALARLGTATSAGCERPPGAAAAIARLAPEILPTVQEMLTSDDPDAVAAALHGVVALGPAGEPLTPVSLSLLTRIASNPSRKLYGMWPSDAMELIEKLGPAAVDATPALVGLFSAAGPDGHWDAEGAGEALVAIGRATIPYLAAIVQTSPAGVDEVDEPTMQARAYAALTLRDIGPPCGEATGALATLLAEGPPLDCVAAEALQQCGEAHRVVEVVGSLLRMASAQKREQGVRLASCLDGAYPAIVTMLTAALDDWDSEVRRLAATGLGRAGQAARPATRALIKAAGTDVLSVRREAVLALGRVGAPATDADGVLLGALAALPAEAARALAQVDSDAVNILTAQLASVDPEVRRGAAVALGSLGNAAVVAQMALYQALGDADETVAAAATSALASVCGAQGKEGRLTDLARYGPPKVRARALEVLALANSRGYGRVPSSVGDILMEALVDGDAVVRGGAAASLGRIHFYRDDVNAGRVEVALAHALADSDPAVRAHAARALREIDRVSDQTARQLIGALRDADLKVRQEAQETLTSVPESLSVLARTLTDADVDVRRRGVWILGHGLGSCGSAASPEVVKALAGAVRDPDPEVRASSVFALAHFTHCADPAVQILLDADSDPDPSIRASALRGLAAIDSLPSEAAARILRSVTADPAPAARVQAALAAGHLGERAVPALIAALGDRNTQVRNAAEEAFFTVGAAATPALARAAAAGDRVRAAGAAAALRWEMGRSVAGAVAPEAEHPSSEPALPRSWPDLEPKGSIDCSSGRLGPWPSSLPDIMATVEALRSFRRGADSLDTDVPADVRPLLTQLKHQIRDAAAALLVSEVDPARDPQVLTNAFADGVLSHLPNTPCDEPPEHNAFGMLPMGTCSFGSIEGVTFDRVASHPDLVAMTATLGIPCGTDSSLYLFKRRDDGWRLALAFEANDYAEVSGAMGSFAYRVSPPDESGAFFVVAAEVNPWCSSNWQSLTVHVLREADDPLRPRSLSTLDRGIYLGMGEPFYKITLAPHEFSIYYPDSQGFEGGFVREHVERYWVDGTKVIRTRPIAGDVIGFIAEWLELPWSEASRSSDPAREDLGQWHARARLLGAVMSAEGPWNPDSASTEPQEICLAYSRKLSALGSYEGDLVPWGELCFKVGSRGGVYVMERVGTTSSSHGAR